MFFGLIMTIMGLVMKLNTLQHIKYEVIDSLLYFSNSKFFLDTVEIIELQGCTF